MKRTVIPCIAKSSFCPILTVHQYMTFVLFSAAAWGYTDGGNVNDFKPRHEKFIEKAVREMEQ